MLGGAGEGRVPHTVPSLPTAEWQVAEARALVHTLDNWSVVETMVVRTRTPDKKLMFGKGNLEQLTGGPHARAPGLLSPLLPGDHSHGGVLSGPGAGGLTGTREKLPLGSERQGGPEGAVHTV